MSVIGILMVILMLAFLVESLTEYFFGAIVQHTPELQKWGWTLMYVAMLAGLCGAFVYQFDLIYLLGQYLTQYFPDLKIPMTAFGIVVTGMAIGRGSNFIHDAVKRYFVKPE